MHPQAPVTASPQSGVKSILARRLEGVSESATLKLNARVQALKAQGVDVVNLTAGEPDFAVPDAAKQAVIEAVHANRSKYTPAAGIPELRQLVADKTNRQQPRVSSQKPWRAADVVISNGGKQSLYNIFMALLDLGDEVLIPSPYWLSYPEMAKLAGGVPRMIHGSYENDFKITPDQLRSKLTAKSKILVFNSPSNPTGAMYSREEYQALGEVLQSSPEGKKVWVVSDEIYDRITFGRIPFCSFLDACPELRDRTLTVNGMSKSAAMTGWRVGWTVGPEEVTQGIITIQGQSTSGVNALAQWASVAALKLPESAFADQVKSYHSRRDLALEILKKTGKIKVNAPDGAFYLFVGVGDFLKAGEDSIAFAERLLEDAGVAVVPGTPFGESGFLRLSFATEEKSLQEGCRRLMDYLQK